MTWNSRFLVSPDLLATPRFTRERSYANKLRCLAPLFKAINLGPSSRVISGSLHDDGSIFRQKPSPEVDEAWYNIALHEAQLINVTAADILASGKDPTRRVRWSEDEDSFPAQVEFSHKIHCLNEIHKEIWGEHYFGTYSIHADDEDHGDGADDDVQGERRKHRQHAMHCLHILLQDLTCNVDVGIITHEWIEVPGRPDDDLVPMADFSTAKQCRDYDTAADWVKGHAVENGLERFGQLRNGYHQMASESEDNYW